jgi:hypothetical protein
MISFAETLNFSTEKENPAAIKLHNRNRDIGYYYDNLSLYCANNDIDLSSVSDDDFMGAAEVMASFGSADTSTDYYFFWID